jgi:hypothetical protein
MSGSCKHNNEQFTFLEGMEFLDHLYNYITSRMRTMGYERCRKGRKKNTERNPAKAATVQVWLSDKPK